MEPKEFNCPGELSDYLLSTVPASLKSRFVIFSRHEDHPDPEIGSLRARHQQEIQAAVAVKVTCTMEYAWNISPTIIAGLARYQVNGCDTGSGPHLLRPFRPSTAGGNEPGEKPIAPPVETVTTTCPPPRYESDVEIFTSSYHTKSPRQDSITLFYDRQPQHMPGYSYVILACSTTKVMNKFIDRLSQSSPLDHLPSGDRYDAKILLQLSQSVFSSQTDSNLLSISTYLSEIHYLARSEPT